jgi:hypothetical protein
MGNGWGLGAVSASLVSDIVTRETKLCASAVEVRCENGWYNARIGKAIVGRGGDGSIG